MDGSSTVPAPNGCGLHPIRLVHGGILLEEGLAIHSVGIALASERPSCQMRQERGSNPGVIIDDIFLRESGRRVQDLLQIRQLQMPALDFDGRVSHTRSAMRSEER